MAPLGLDLSVMTEGSAEGDTANRKTQGLRRGSEVLSLPLSPQAPSVKDRRPEQSSRACSASLTPEADLSCSAAPGPKVYEYPGLWRAHWHALLSRQTASKTGTKQASKGAPRRQRQQRGQRRTHS